MSNIPSNNIVVFPLSKARGEGVDGDVARESKIFFENNIANIVRQMLDTNGFIISPSLEDTDALGIVSNTVVLNGGRHLEFNIGGYYVRIFNKDSGGIPLYELSDNSTTGSIYASITFDQNKEISKQDYNNLYEGLTLAFYATDSTAPEDSGDIIYFKLIDIKDGTAEFCKDSYIKFDLNSYKFPKFIDGQR